MNSDVYNFTVIRLLIEGKIGLKISFLNFTLGISTRGVADFIVYLSYLGAVGSKKFPQTWSVKSVVPSEVNVLHF